MIVCSCRTVTDRTIEAVIASGAQTIDDISTLCSAGGRCGGCWPTLQRLLDQDDVQQAADAEDAAA